ncbi:phage baseplate plug family protein [Paenibacillus spongiae]|uniref:Cyanophage baseplate Pam3 plug gp18 domain-containing protein n=1 Tax=Paenibacillus spongiae TaxID=2909671 RepID=A0ABY5S3W0_9BACL|nr:hypothetical protein [Paenibacillus spongiae]UVI28163.1 hypothetical protein L1F29_22255 [Paenibacillus spongiae]
MNYVDIEKELIPYRFDIEIAEETFSFEVNYNAEHDFFTIDLSLDGEVLAAGVKLVYGVPLFGDIQDHRFPAYPLLPLDLAGDSQSVNWETLSVRVFLYIIDEEAIDDG